MPTATTLSLPHSRDALGTPEAAAIIKRELESLPASALPLQSLLQHSAHALEDDLQITVLSVALDDDVATVRVGVFFQGVDPGCSCADDPSPVSPVPEYGELDIEIDRHTGEARCLIGNVSQSL